MAVRNLSKDRDIALPEGVLTRDAHAVVERPDDRSGRRGHRRHRARPRARSPRRSRNGKPVVTGNKELLANVGTELYAAADEAGVDLLFEAAVAGGIPLIRALRESLRGEPITPGDGHRQRHHQLHPHQDDRGGRRLLGGAVARRRRSGFAERDPTADVEGFDAGAKAAIIATIAFGVEGRGRRRVPRGHQPHHRRTTSPSPRASATW